MTKIILKSRKKLYYAEGSYSPKTGKVTVLKGSHINLNDNYSKMASQARNARCCKEFVDDNGYVLKNIEFKSASAAAQFVIGDSSNGMMRWRVDDKISLKEYLSRQ